MIKTVMNVEEVAKYLGFSAKKIYRLVETNKIPASKIGRQYRFMTKIIDDWLESKNILPTPNWSQRLDTVLGRMRTISTRKNISYKDIEQEIKKSRASKA